jgi:hypothetical protein
MSFVANWKDKVPMEVVAKVESEMRTAVCKLNEEATQCRRKMKMATMQEYNVPPPHTTTGIRKSRISSQASDSRGHNLTPKELFGSSSDTDDDQPRTPKRMCLSDRKWMVDKGNPSSNEWMGKYPGVTTRDYWNEGSDATPGGDLESALKNVVGS